MAGLEIEVRLDRLDALTDAIRARAATAIAKAAFDIEAAAKPLAPVDTGAHRAAISAITATGSDYDANTTAAAALNPGAQVAPAPAPADDLEAFVVAPMEYAAYLEYGTVHAPAQPSLTPALEAVRPSLEQAWEDLQP